MKPRACICDVLLCSVLGSVGVWIGNGQNATKILSIFIARDRSYHKTELNAILKRFKSVPHCTYTNDVRQPRPQVLEYIQLDRHPHLEL